MTSLATYAQQNPLTKQQPGFLTKNVINPIKSAFSSGVNEVKQGYETSKAGAESGNIGQLLGGASHIITGVGGAAAAPAAPVLQRPLGAAVGGVSNAISDNPDVQNFAQSGVGQATANVAGAVAQGAGVVGTVGGAMETIKGTSNIWDKAYNSPSAIDVASQARDSAAQSGVSSLQEMTGQVGDFKNDLGTSFRQGAENIEKTNPDMKLTLSHDQIDALNTLKNNKSFSLPDYLKKTSPGFGSSDIADVEKGGISLTPTQAQDLITQLNKSTFTEKASGLAVDQTKIGLTNEIKAGAKQAFGGENSPWSKVYSDYAKGSQAVEKISDIVNLDKNATPSDVNKSLSSILKLSKSPEGKIILQNAINEFKQTSGIDLTKGTEAISQILDKQEALDAASKPGFIKQVVNPVYLGRAAVRYGLIYLGLKGIINAVKGQ